MAAEQPKPTKRQARILRSLRRSPGYFIDRTRGHHSRLMVDAGWISAKPIAGAPGHSTYRITDAGREALKEFQRVALVAKDAEDGEKIASEGIF